MTMSTKYEVIKEHLPRYLRSSRRERGLILKYLSVTLGIGKRSVIRSLKRERNRDPWREQKTAGRKPVYGPEAIAALRHVWEAGNEVCAELLFPMVAEYAAVLRRDGLWPHCPRTTTQLLQMSQGTMKRRIGAFRKARHRHHGLSATKPSQLRQIVPVFTGPWTDKPPGYGQIDTVLHSDSAAGDAVYTVNYTDAATLMTVPRAQWNKGQAATQTSMDKIRMIMPFTWLGTHPDGGSEFMNRNIVEWCQAQRIELTRSRPNRKNDNMYVEERNGHVIRKTIGYLRLDCLEAVDALNAVYDVLTPYLLHFIAIRRSTGKEKIGSKYRRTYERTAKTPYQRIMEHPAAAEDVKERLRQTHITLNPLLLKQELDRKVDALYATQQRLGNHRS